MINLNLDASTLEIMEDNGLNNFAKDYILSYILNKFSDVNHYFNEELQKLYKNNEITEQLYKFSYDLDEDKVVVEPALMYDSILSTDILYNNENDLKEAISLIHPLIWKWYFNLNINYDDYENKDEVIEDDLLDDKLPLSYDIVEKEVLDHLDECSSVTTLEIKNSLRAKGYLAYQSEVSDFMKSVARENDLDFNAVQSGDKLHLEYSHK